MMETPKPGEIVTDGKAINIGAPIAEARISSTFQPSEPSAVQILGMAIRHLKGLATLIDELRWRIDRLENEKK